LAQLTKWVTEGLKRGARPDASTRRKRSEIQHVVVQTTLGFRVSREENLEASVEPEAVYEVGSDTSTNGISGLE
jgi:hypothetical protein